jgi:hypothetical protein
LGLDPVAAGAHFAALNRFARVSEQAGLTLEQRQQLLTEAQTGEVSPGLRHQIEGILRQRQQSGQAAGLKAEDVIASAQAMPETLHGPVAVKLPGAPAAKEGSTFTPSTPVIVTPTKSAEPLAMTAVAKITTSPVGLAQTPKAPVKQPPASPSKEEAMAATGRVMASTPPKEKRGTTPGDGLPVLRVEPQDEVRSPAKERQEKVDAAEAPAKPSDMPGQAET